jgi:hypothetical protein
MFRRFNAVLNCSELVKGLTRLAQHIPSMVQSAYSTLNRHVPSVQPHSEAICPRANASLKTRNTMNVGIQLLPLVLRTRCVPDFGFQCVFLSPER